MRFGVSTKEITPNLPVELAGYGYNLKRIASSIDSPLMATALAIEGDNGHRTVVCGVDLISVDEHTVAKVQKSVNDTDVVFQASHSHSTPATHELLGAGGYNRDYVNHVVVPKLTAAVLESLSNLYEGEIGLDRIALDGLSYNRTGGASLDARLSVLRIDTDAARIVGAHFPCHPVIYGRKSRVMSSEYPGAVREVLQDRVNSTNELWLTGFCGDINPTISRGREDVTTRADIVSMGTAIGKAASELHAGIKTKTGDVRSLITQVEVPVDTAFELHPLREVKAYREARGISKTLPRKTRDLKKYKSAIDLARWLKKVEPIVNGYQAETLLVPVTVTAIGDIVLVGCGAEIFNSTGLALEQERPDLQLVTMMNTNEHQGYIPTADSYEKGDYASRPSAYIFARKPLMPNSEAVFRAGVSAAIQQLVPAA